MRADAAEALGRAKGSEAGSRRQFDLVLRHLQSLLASRLGVNLSYRGFGDEDMLRLRMRGEPTTHAELRQRLQYTFLQFVAMGYIRGMYSGVVTAARIYAEFDSKLFARVSASSELNALLSPPASGAPDGESPHRQDITRSGLYLSAAHAAHALRLGDLEAVEPTIGGRRHHDVVFEQRERAAVALKELLRMEGLLEDARMEQPHFNEGIVSLTRIRNDIDVGRLQCAGFSGDEISQGRVPLDVVRALREKEVGFGATSDVAFVWLRDLACLVWTREKPLGAVIDELLKAYPSSAVGQLRADLMAFFASALEIGLDDRAFGSRFRDQQISSSVLHALAADGGPRSLLLRLPSWHVQLTHAAKQAYLSAEFAYGAYLDHRPTPRVPSAPTDWSPVLLGYAIAIEAELAMRPYRHAVERLRDDETRWPTARLEELSSPRAPYRQQGLAKEVLRYRRDPASVREPTLGQLANYFKWGVELLRRGEFETAGDLPLDWLKHVRDHLYYARLLNPAFIEGLSEFVRYRNWAAHPHDVEQDQLLVARRLGTSILESLVDCRVARQVGRLL